MIGWFGESWGAPMCEEANHIPTPVGAFCISCDEPIAVDDHGVVTPQYGLDAQAAEHDPLDRLSAGGHRYIAFHLECHLRGVLGSVGHIEGWCSCVGGDFEDPPGLTKREAACAAVAAFERRHGSQVGR